MKKTLAIMLALIMVLALVPTVAFAAGEVAWINGQGYATLGDAVKAAKSGDTITLGEGKYTLYEKKANVLNKDLTFVGAGTDKTTWLIGPKVPDPEKYGTEYNSDYSFDVRSTEAKETVTFKNMTLQSGRVDYLGFAGTDNTIVEDCIIEGKTFYWGYTSAIFTKTTFKCPDGDYALWSYSSATMTFDNCTFNSSGKVINVYNEGGTPNVEVNFKNCTVNNAKGTSKKAVLNINDRLVGGGFTINISGNNSVDGITADDMTCSCLFGFGGKEKNPEYVNGTPYYSNNKKTVVTINDVKVWENGERACPHNGVVFTTGSYNGDVATQYTDGYKDKAFTVTPNGPGSFEVKCDYCGYKEISTGELSNEIGLTRTVNVTQNSNSVLKDAANPNKYKVANSRNIAVDYTATMDMTNLEWKVAGKDVKDIPGALGTANSPWELLKYLASKQQIDGKTEVILTFKFDDDKIDLGTFQTNYNATKPEDKEKLLKLTSDMFEMTDVVFGTDNTMTIKCNWNWNKETDPDHAPAPKITLNGYGLPVKNGWNGSKIDIKNSGCVGGTVHIKNPRTEKKLAMAEIAPNVAANIQVSSTYPPVDNTIQIPIVGGCKTDEFTLYYGGGSSGDSGHSHYYPTTTPVPVIVIPPKTGDMTVWQSILHFLGIR